MGFKTPPFSNRAWGLECRAEFDSEQEGAR